MLVLAYLEIPTEFPQARSIFTILGVYPTQLFLHVNVVVHLKKMTIEQKIKSIIDKELSEVKNLHNVYGLDLTKCLIEPRKEKYKSSTDETITFDLWTVLEETQDRFGYKITFDNSDNQFGLGIMTDKNELMDIGTYGTFLETLKGM